MTKIKCRDDLVDVFIKLENNGFTNVPAVRRFKEIAGILLKREEEKLSKLRGSNASEYDISSMECEIDGLREKEDFLPWGWDTLVKWHEDGIRLTVG